MIFSVRSIARILNLSENELPRVALAWTLTFLTRIGFILGWTILIASFLSHVGINFLPLLFLINALLMMLGTVVYRRLLHRIKKELLITVTVLFGAALLIASAALMRSNTALFFILFLLAQGIFISQLSILIGFFNEEFFSASDSQRAFPIIESADTVGGILAGLALSTFGASLPPYKFILIGVLFLLIVLPIVLKYNARTIEVPDLEKGTPHPPKKWRDLIRTLKKIPFVKALAILILLHWAIINVLEFQSMKAVEQNVYSTEEQTLVVAPENPNIILAETPDPALHYQEDLTQKLGLLHLIFYSAALLMQLVAASRILSNLGVVPSMMIHPLLTLINVLGMTLQFNLMTASLTRGSYELTGILFKNASGSSTYGIELDIQEDAKELLQGLVRPLGAILGTASMMSIAFFTQGPLQTLMLNVLIVAGAILMLFFLRNLAKKYTAMCESNLSHKKDLPTRLCAIDILGQSGHNKKFPALQKLLKRPQEPLILKESILHTLGLQEDLESIGVILEMLESPEEVLRHSAIEALSCFKNLKKHLMMQAFTRRRVIESLKHLLLTEHDECVREEALQCFFNLAPEELTTFLMETVETHSSKKAAFIQMLRLFPDPNLTYYLTRFLDDPDPEVKAATLVALWQFPHLQGSLHHHLKHMLQSPHKNVLLCALEASGRVRFKEAAGTLHSYLSHKDPAIQKEALLALTSLEEESAALPFVELLANPLHEWFNHTGTVLNRLPHKWRNEIQQLLHLHLVENIHSLLNAHKGIPVKQWEKEAILSLKKLYAKINAHHEIHRLQKLLDSTD